jgi:hypothetical protein
MVIGFLYFFAFLEEIKGSSWIGGYIMPWYIAFSGLIVILIEFNIKIIVRNMKFLYNYIGRGFFNIYIGVMPIILIPSDTNKGKSGF